ncbi:uncharacterized protein FOMMEDRAFT_101779 [Fomitiporia mediterranea MF3/22]|uniref:uncharacterized protein n=1 Tax=Fomitiporia mediterranea (strain MF3/22) TaxID=694068 RepID=UPI0004409375|nr:uncharacterized protein FOMMEDRAFT_101779 [Fomitiporia mediterranea MF3/22]EJD08367.1 hypothetical protein FOMMEDRAFT_101779 [Fomitiporia mediterranea MF3/22]
MVDVLVLGATGYTGKLITRYLAVHRERGSFTFGLAGRSKSKLAQLVSDLNIPEIQTYTVDVTDDESLSSLLSSSRAKVLLSTVGPYMRWGMPVARACARSGVHYVDIDGEAPFVKDLIMEVDYLATKTGSILVPSSGFDSVPADLLVYLSAITMRKALNEVDATNSSEWENVGITESHTMYSAKGGVSGGTLATVFLLLESFPRKKLAKLMAPDVLSPIKLRTPSSPKLVYTFPGIRSGRYGHAWPLGPHNVAIVQRSHGLFHLQASAGIQDEEVERPAYAENFMYTESQAASNQFVAFFAGLGLMLRAACLVLFPPIRWLAKRLVIQPGQGPSDEVLQNGYVKMQNISVSSPLPGTNKSLIIESFARGRGDPGYALTAVMSAEVALGLLAPREKLPAIARSGGVLTPATALGSALLKRLSASGRFEFENNVRED